MKRRIAEFVRRALHDMAEVPARAWIALATVMSGIGAVLMPLTGEFKLIVESGPAAILASSGVLTGAIYAFQALGSRWYVKRKKRLARPPASRLVGVLRAAFPARLYDMVFSQILCDFREEHAQMLVEKRPGRAWWLSVLLWWTLFITLVTWTITNIVKRAVSIWKIG